MGDFEKAVDDISNKIAKTMTDDELKEVYGLYKQATVGDINIEKPSVTDPKVKFPWYSYLHFNLESRYLTGSCQVVCMEFQKGYVAR